MTARAHPDPGGAAPRQRVALVHDWLTGMRGGEKVLEILADLYPRAPIYSLFHFPGSVSERIERHAIHTSFLQEAPAARRHYRRYLPLFPAAIEDLDLSSFDLIVSTSHCVAKGIRPRPGARHVCYCHTPMRYVWDQEAVYFPRRHGPVARLRGLVLGGLRRWDVKSSARVDQFVANSSFVAGRIRRYYRRQAMVVHPPVDTEFYTPGEAADGGYLLLVSALAPYKRVDLAIAAARRLGRELRVVGDGPERARLERLAGDDIRLLGRVDDEELRQLYRGAHRLLQPGVEDFGISSVEALACGCPVVALGQGGILDIVRDGRDGLLYQGEGEVDALAAAIDKSDEISFNKLDLSRRAAAFSADRFTERMQSILATRQSGRT